MDKKEEKLENDESRGNTRRCFSCRAKISTLEKA